MGWTRLTDCTQCLKTCPRCRCASCFLREKKCRVGDTRPPAEDEKKNSSAKKPQRDGTRNKNKKKLGKLSELFPLKRLGGSVYQSGRLNILSVGGGQRNRQHAGKKAPNCECLLWRVAGDAHLREHRVGCRATQHLTPLTKNLTDPAGRRPGLTQPLLFISTFFFCPSLTDTGVRGDKSTITGNQDETSSSLSGIERQGEGREGVTRSPKDGGRIALNHSWRSSIGKEKREMKKKRVVAKVNLSSSAYFRLFRQLDQSVCLSVMEQ